jgi:hypothetical protein
MGRSYRAPCPRGSSVAATCGNAVVKRLSNPALLLLPDKL